MNAIRSLGLACLSVLAAIGLAGCESQDTDDREIRVENDGPTAVHVLVDGAEVMVVQTFDSDGYDVSADVHEVRLQDPKGRKIWEQYIDLSEGQYAKFKIKEDGSVVASGGLTYDPSSSSPYYSDNADEDARLRVSNHWSGPVHVWIDGEEKKVVATGDLRSVNPGGGEHLVELKSDAGQVLFSQAVRFKDSQYILYTIERDGTVVASGGMI